MERLNASDTAARLPYRELAEQIAAALPSWQAGEIAVPERTTLALPEQGILLVMPAAAADLAITKLVTVHPGNRALGLPTIQGEVIAMRAASGERLGVLDGATVTERRTAALSLLAAERLAPDPTGPLLVIGAGVQARAHVEAFRAGLGSERVIIASRTRSGAEALARHARTLGMDAVVTDDPLQGVPEAKLIVTATTSALPVLDTELADDAMVCAVGAFRPDMAEISPALVAGSSVVVDTLDGARHEAGDLIQAAAAGVWDWQRARTLADFLEDRAERPRPPVLFKSVGHALFDLAATRLAFPG